MASLGGVYSVNIARMSLPIAQAVTSAIRPLHPVPFFGIVLQKGLTDFEECRCLACLKVSQEQETNNTSLLFTWLNFLAGGSGFAEWTSRTARLFRSWRLWSLALLSMLGLYAVAQMVTENSLGKKRSTSEGLI